VPAVDTVQLLSGGLDSFCGALLQMRHDDRVVYIGHRDQSKAVRHAQNVIEPAVRKSGAEYLRWALRPAITVKEPTPRTRSLLFMALAVAVADARGARRVIMPENGFTSINPPLEPSRGGPLTTRSTHPWTFHLLARLLAELGLIDIEVFNPFGGLTKGELVAAALQPDSTDDVTLAAQTLSCAKPNAGRLKGGNANLNCGWCIACLVRRSAFLAGGIQDQTRYLVDVLPPASKERFLHYRRHDIAAWRYAGHAGLDEYRILGSGMWPPNTDFDAVIEICKRGLEELRLVPDP
jgi:7-cyano-7-deazaguanine synthase in queuosine biosynthesis